MQLTSGQQQPSETTIDDAHSQPQPGPGPIGMKMAKQQGKWEVTIDVPFLNLDPFVHLVGLSNEVPITVVGRK